LSVLDERYLFTGAHFVVYLVSTIPKVILILAVLTAPFLILYLLYRLLPERLRVLRLPSWCFNPLYVAVLGIILSLLEIQFVMCQCFFFSNLLLAPELPGPAWLDRLLVDDELMPPYFSGLVAGTALSVALSVVVRAKQPSGRAVTLARGLLTFLAAVQFLLLPINYGVLIVDKSLPRVAALGDRPLEAGQEAWLVWEGKEGVTWLVRSGQENHERRSLVTLPRSDVKKTEITGYDPIFAKLFPIRESRT
jgi:hypothetical protein